MTLARAEGRRLIAHAARTLAVAGMFDYHGHVSLRDGDVVYINGRQSSRMTLRPEEVAVVGLADGAPLDGVEPPSETAIHLCVLRARPDVGSVIHYHALTATAFAVARRPLVTAYNAGVLFGREVPVYDDPELVTDDRLGGALARALGTGRGVLMRGHGVTVVGDDIPAAVTAALYLEESARRLARTIALGEPTPFTDDEIKRVSRIVTGRSVVEKTWTDAVERARLAGALDGLD